MTHYETKKILKYIKKGSVSKLRSFLRKNDVNLNEIRDSENRGVLHLSCYLGECKMSRFLLRYGVDPCLTDCEGNTPIHIALKYALEFNNQSVFLNLILPLKKRSKRVMNLANKLGETPGVLYDKLKTELRNELSDKEELLERGKNGKRERETNEFEEENNFEAECAERLERQEWFEKLAFEESCEDFYFKVDHDSLLDEQGETYDHWAERIRREHSTKYQKVTVTRSSTTEAKKQEHLKMNETLTKKLAKEHEEYINNVKLKQTKRRKEKYEENCQNVFECSNTDRLTFESIPWPCAGSAADIVDKLSEWAGVDKIGYLKVQRVRWHPDRFAQRCRHRIENAERERIMDLVKQVSQGINVMISSL
ncbi:Hypothetical predicted protein [Paramuricea clavata]|uniref:NF-kappa-B inhibitor-like protein 1 n=1 Tax=Paramuricea clavata TaxID=317549 RepID=A0A6S7I5Q6_PARCT|nr:Hypothetical predicted protein [Paramuricea clavata]